MYGIIHVFSGSASHLLNRILAIDTATEALSLAFQDGPRLCSLHRIIPRQHQQQLFPLLAELLDGRSPAELGLDAVAFGSGPGSFTGLRIAASAAQGLGYSLQVPVLGISTLETQARTLLRREALDEPCVLLSTIDARIGQVYAAFYHFDGARLSALSAPRVCAPEALSIPEAVQALHYLPLLGLGTGYGQRSAMPVTLGDIDACWPELLPEAQDMLEPASAALDSGLLTPATQALPDYVQQRIGWKTLAEQGRSA
ncbi:MAG: tRNA threonylcarbamoyladenosine biosynthesis protein TsaB [Halieaceae bacterium]